MSEELGAVVGVYRRDPMKAVGQGFAALLAFGLGGACLWAIFEMKPKSTGLPWLFVLACLIGGVFLVLETLKDGDLLLELHEQGFRLRRAGLTTAARWREVKAWSTRRYNGRDVVYTLELGSGQTVRFHRQLERFEELGQVLRETLRQG